MPQPTRNEVHTDRILTNISVAYLQSSSYFVSWKVFPQVGVEKQSDIYYTYPRGTWFRDEAARRADGTQSEGTGFGLDTDDYSCKVYALHQDLGPQAMKNQDTPINLERDAVNLLTQKLMLRQETQWVSDFFTTGVWGTDLTGASSGGDFVFWDDYTNSDPIGDVEAWKETILSTTGIMPNTLVIGYQTWRWLKNHPAFIGRIQYTSSEVVTQQLIAKYFELDNIYVAQAIKNTAAEGATDAYSFIHGKNGLLCYSAPAPGLMTPTAGYCLTWNGISDGFGESVSFTREEVPLTRGAIRIEGQIAWDNKVVASELGIFLSGMIS